MSEGIDVRVENRLIRFIPATPVDRPESRLTSAVSEQASLWSWP